MPAAAADVDECATNKGGCDPGPAGLCINNIGGPPTCNCTSGYQVDPQDNKKCVTQVAQKQGKGNGMNLGHYETCITNATVA